MDPVARRYAQALTEEAQSAGQLDAADADVALVAETLDGSRELRLALTSPVVPSPKKRAVLDRLFEGRVSDLTTRFLHLLVEKQRDGQIPDILEAYRLLRDERTGTVEATVRTARPLSAEEAERLKTALQGRSGKTVRMDLRVDPSLIGGLVVRLGDVVYDRSVRHQLDTLRGQLAQRAAVSLN
ncbi:ATP synthase F1 subunit delta [Rubrivirga marina]|uniref:ATP synthase subunit delta n=1 Tax=Rubrivirga marina TaxID=1196024 RepID=A0A271J4I5_9BACT|nr:ATP synthase F1 subunit delta [Rubrivirga marina]PAP78353.1 ATP synthase F1 subunit delta [Rubrivirga marina]